MSFTAQTLLIQFAKAPLAGEVKTRLASVLSETDRLDLHSAMTAWVCAQLQGVAGAFELWVAGDGGDGFMRDLQRQYQFAVQTQKGADLGERMSHAIAKGLQSHQQVIIVGSDCPFIDRSYLESAIRQLITHDVVIGPANDGGYVLLGLKGMRRQLFQGIDWGTGKVLEQTLAIITAEKLSVAFLRVLTDIDRPDDLAALNSPELPPSLRRFALIYN